MPGHNVNIFSPKEFITSLLLYNIFLIIIYMKKISQFWFAESSAVLTKYSAKIENTGQFEILTIFVIKHIVLLLSFWQMFFRQSEVNKLFCTSDANVWLNFQIKTWSHPLSQSEPSILMLYIPLTVLIHQVLVMVASYPGK